MRQSRRGFLTAGLAAAGLVPLGVRAEGIASSPRPPVRPDGLVVTPAEIADALIAAAKLDARVTYAVADAVTGEILDAREADAEMPPASVLKAVTALYALDRLSPAFRFATRVTGTGSIEAGMLQGDLVLAGGGDPTLQTDQLGDLVARLAATGLRGVTGRFLYDDGALPALAEVAEGQPLHVGYNPAIAGLNLNFNRVHFGWTRANGAWALTMDARGERFLPEVRSVTVAAAPGDRALFAFDQGAGAEHWTVAEAQLGKAGSRWLPVRRPGAYAAEVFATLALAQGIRLPAPQAGQASAGSRELGRVDSEALPRLLTDMLKFSTNLTAECVGLTASGLSDLPASAASMQAWAAARLGMAGRFVDHSGLGPGSRLTAAAMVEALVAARAARPGLAPLLREVGMRDDQGKVIEGHPVRVVAKSGTLNFVSGLAGHILPPGGRELVFAVFAGDPARRDAVPVADREAPPGAEAWTRRARRLQGQLVSRWAAAFG